MNDYVFQIRQTRFGRYFCVAKPTREGLPTLISRKDYTNGEEAVQDVIADIRERELRQPLPGIPSAAAGGMR